ncbi:MAG: hypothetical protein GY701_22905 [Sulfitobacter sp.]|nr:hypothetical protein [Sulfitobacter sp.]
MSTDIRTGTSVRLDLRRRTLAVELAIEALGDDSRTESRLLDMAEAIEFFLGGRGGKWDPAPSGPPDPTAKIPSGTVADMFEETRRTH